MKRDILLRIAFIFSAVLLLFFNNCGNTEEEQEPNKSPTCNITNPTNNAAIEIGTSVQISVTANDPDGSISNLKISIDDVSKATLQTAPYTYDWNTADVSPGQHTIKAVATDNGNLTATSQVTVTVTADAPTVTTADISEITDTSATGGGNVTDDGGVDVTARGVVWGEASGPTIENNDGFTEDGTGTGEFTSSLTNLTANTTYYVKAYATNSQGTAYGVEKSFTTTGGTLPTVVTGIVQNVTNNSAECINNNITDDGGEPVTARGLVWGTMFEPTLENNEGFRLEGGMGTGTFSVTMESLSRVTDYYVRAYATNSAGTAYGLSTYFKTLPDPPTVNTADITNISAHIATGGGEVIDDGGADAVYVGIVWSTSPNPDINNYEGFWSSMGNPFEAFLSGLDPETTYYVRAFANNSGALYVYGEEKTFTTSAFTVQTGSFTDTRDNTVYNTVTTNGQTWMAENLAYLPEVCASDAQCGYWVYDYQGTDVDEAKLTSNYSTYGVLYDFETAQNVCPAGWHLPSDEEWAFLEMNLGMDYNTALYGDIIRGTDEGGKLKETGTTHWAYPNLGASNISQFTALPGGERDGLNNNNVFQYLGSNSYFWTSTNTGSLVVSRNLSSGGARIGRSYDGPDGRGKNGMSVRCVQN